MRKEKIILTVFGLIISTSLLTACSSNNTNSSVKNSSSSLSSSSSSNKSSSSAGTSKPASSNLSAITNDNLTNESAQLLAAWTIKLNKIADGKPVFQAFTGTKNIIYLLNTGASGSNGSTEISALMKATTRVKINSDGTYSLEALDTTVSNAMSQNPFGAGPWNTLQTQSLDELNSSFGSDIGGIVVSLNQAADPSVIAE